MAGSINHFQTLTKDGAGQWILNGTLNDVGLHVIQGTLAIANTVTNLTALPLIDLGGTLQIGSGGTTGSLTSDIINNGTLAFNRSNTLTFANLISGTGGITQAGSGTTNVSTAQSYTGKTVVNAGTLQTGVTDVFASSSDVIVNGGTLNLAGNNQRANRLAGAGGTVLLSGATLTANNATTADNTTFAGTITDGGLASSRLVKIGQGKLTLTANNAFGSVDVQEGTLQFEQANASTTLGNYTTQADATTTIGMNNSTLNVAGVFTQADGATLNVTLGASPDIVAQSANLGGTLIVNGFSDTQDPAKASSVTSMGYILLHTQDGITGNFVNQPLEQTGLDYLLHDGHVDIANGGFDYELGFRLAWTEGGQEAATGSFTLNEGTGFDVDIALNNQPVPDGGFASGWDGQSLVKDGAGRLVLSAQNGYTGSTTVKDGVLEFNTANSIATSSDVIVNGGIVNLKGNDQQFNRLAGSGGEIQLNGAALTVMNTTAADNSLYTGAITGNGTFIKKGAGNLTLSGDTAWVGDTELQAGSLILDGTTGGARLTSNVVGQSGSQLSLVNGASLTGWIDPTDVVIDSASQWNMTANSQVATLAHGGTLNFVAPGAGGFKILDVAGNYVGNNGLLVMNTRLGDDSSLTDKLVVKGDTAGTTRVQIVNAGGSGAQTLNGIEVITVGGQSDGEFVQAGRIVAGAYDYTLARGTAADTAVNWYLTSQSRDGGLDIRPEAGAYNTNLAAANTLFVTRLHDRLGETQYIDVLTGEHKVTSMWLRNEGGHNRSRDESGQLNTQANRYVLQLGGDIAQWSHDGLDRYHLGLMAGYGNSKSNTASHQSNYDAKGSVDGYSVGVYGTWYANAADKSGWYVDSWAQYGWFDNSVTSQGMSSEEYKSKGVTASVESGYTFKLGENTAQNMRYFIQPKAQLTWMGVKADDHREANGTWVKGEGDGNIQTRLGVKAFINGYSDQDKGKERVFQPFVEANWVHNSKDFGSNMDGVSVKQAGAANIGELKLGVEGQLSKQVNLWGNVGQQVGNKGYSDTTAMLGVKYNF
ncbi:MULTISPECIES: autotransporter outer membrane beta-barrel domain-containing protein [unclassified Serratia (in: enterobacteria)]|uniref:autotransporter outer membrane beta-barrel domain-containing protein n=1 Tax=unclassified Serratia (in: enterobacteria) TaxID=2647522 RepID=UPI0030767A36